MSTDISRQQIIHLANLARLDLSEDEIASYQKELSAIVAFVSQPPGGRRRRARADGAGHPGSKMSAAPDNECPALGLSLDDLALNAEMEARQIKIPKINF